MKIFVDTSALYASFNADDLHHNAVEEALKRLRATEAELLTTNYALVECASLLQRRKGFLPAKEFLAQATQMLEILWVDGPLHQEAVSIWSRAQNRSLSLVDCTSFAGMRHTGIHRALAFDPHFAQQGFEVIP